MRERGVGKFEAGLIAASLAASGSGCKPVRRGFEDLGEQEKERIISLREAGQEIREELSDLFVVRDESQVKSSDKKRGVKREVREGGVEIKKELDSFSFQDVFEEANEHASSADKKKRRGEVNRIMTGERAMVYAVKFRGSKKSQEDHFQKPIEDREYASQVRAHIITYCNKYNVPYDIAYSVGANESGFDQDKESHVGAVGVFQVMEIAANDVGFESKDRHDLEKNIEMGIKYLAQLYERYKKWDIALVIYSTGEGNLKKMIGSKKDMTSEEAESYLGRDDVDLIRLYSGKFDGLGTKHPFQYPFQAAALGSAGRSVLEHGEMSPVMKDSEFVEALKKWPSLKRRIQKKPNFKGTSFIQRVEKRLSKARGKQNKRVASK